MNTPHAGLVLNEATIEDLQRGYISVDPIKRLPALAGGYSDYPIANGPGNFLLLLDMIRPDHRVWARIDSKDASPFPLAPGIPSHIPWAKAVYITVLLDSQGIPSPGQDGVAITGDNPGVTMSLMTGRNITMASLGALPETPVYTRSAKPNIESISVVSITAAGLSSHLCSAGQMQEISSLELYNRGESAVRWSHTPAATAANGRTLGGLERVVINDPQESYLYIGKIDSNDPDTSVEVVWTGFKKVV